MTRVRYEESVSMHAEPTVVGYDNFMERPIHAYPSMRNEVIELEASLTYRIPHNFPSHIIRTIHEIGSQIFDNYMDEFEHIDTIAQDQLPLKINHEVFADMVKQKLKSGK